MNVSQSMSIFLKGYKVYICRSLVRMMANSVYWGPNAVCKTHTVQESLFLVLTILQDSVHTPVPSPANAHSKLDNNCEQEKGSQYSEYLLIHRNWFG